MTRGGEWSGRHYQVAGELSRTRRRLRAVVGSDGRLAVLRQKAAGEIAPSPASLRVVKSLSLSWKNHPGTFRAALVVRYCLFPVDARESVARIPPIRFPSSFAETWVEFLRTVIVVTHIALIHAGEGQNLGPAVKPPILNIFPVSGFSPNFLATIKILALFGPQIGWRSIDAVATFLKASGGKALF